MILVLKKKRKEIGTQSIMVNFENFYSDISQSKMFKIHISSYEKRGSEVLRREFSKFLRSEQYLIDTVAGAPSDSHNSMQLISPRIIRSICPHENSPRTILPTKTIVSC